MIKKSFFLVLFFLPAMLLRVDDVGARTNDNEQMHITIPWQEFKNILHLDEKEIVLSLETFQKLLSQTGIKEPPSHLIRDGNVILSRAEFDKLVGQMKPPPESDVKPPSAYLMTKAFYSGVMKKENTVFTCDFQVHALQEDAYIKVPFLPQNMALEDVKIDGEPALVLSERGYHHVLIKEKGSYHITAVFSVMSSLEKGPHRIDLSIVQAPITLLQLDIPLTRIDVEIPQAQQIRTVADSRKTRLYGVLASGNSVSIRWRKKIPVTEKIPPKLYAEIQQLLSIEDDAFRTQADVFLNVLHSEIDGVRFIIPDQVNVLSVSGEGVGEWQENTAGKQRVLTVPFTYGKKGSITIHMVSELPISDNGQTTTFSGIRVLDAVRENGFVGVELNTSAEVKVADSDGVEKIPVQKLPQHLYNKSNKPLILGFKYLKHPYQITLHVEKHEKIAVPVANIHSVNAVSLFTEDGKIVHRIVYQVRNSAKQFLEIQMPDSADVWSVFVGNEPVESSLNSEGRLLIPLIRSRSISNRLDTFPVEVIYCMVDRPFASIDQLDVQLPQVDLLTSQLFWSIYLPNDYAYLRFESTLEKEEMIKGLNLFTASKRSYNEGARQALESKEEDVSTMSHDKLQQIYKGKDYRSRFKNVPVDEEQMRRQVENEFRMGDRLDELSKMGYSQSPSVQGAVSTGVLPVQIKIPTSGQVYRFARTIIKPDDELTVNVLYSKTWMIALLKWVLAVFAVIVLYLLRKVIFRLWSWLKGYFLRLQKFYNKHRQAVTNLSRARLTPFVLFGLFLLSLSFSGIIALIILFVLWIIIVDRVFIYRDNRKKKKPGAPRRK